MKGFHDSKKGTAIIFDDIFLVNGARTPFGKLGGTLARISATDLGIYASKAAIGNAGISPQKLHQVIVANIGQSSADAYFLPRHIGLYAGLPDTITALMVQRICGSGLETIISAAEQITLSKAGAVLCAGTESMSQSPTAAFGNRLGYVLGKPGFVDMLWEALNDTAAVPMGCTAENIARKHGISREEADIFAGQSAERCIAAQQEGFFNGEIIKMNSAVFEAEGLNPRKVNLPRGVSDFSTDENVRLSDLSALAKLSPSFEKNGVQTAANSSGIVDGAAAAVIASGRSIKESGTAALSRVVAAASSALDPKMMGLGPVPAIRYLLEVTGLSVTEIGLFEINEAFAAQFIGCEKELGLDRNRCNIHGGAIAIGHPLAATGIRLSLTLSRAMRNKNIKYGIASACIGGGQGTAILFENTEQ